MRTKSHKAMLLALAVMVAVVPAAVMAKKAVQQGSPKIDNIMKCRAIADAAQRLACYDANISPLETALAKKEILVVDRSRAEAANRSLFGYGSSGFGQFLGLGDLDHIESTVVSAGRNADGGVTVTLADGSRWSQQDDKPMWGDIKAGTKVEVVRGTLGSYIVRIKGQVGFKAIRIG